MVRHCFLYVNPLYPDFLVLPLDHQNHAKNCNCWDLLDKMIYTRGMWLRRKFQSMAATKRKMLSPVDASFWDAWFRDTTDVNTLEDTYDTKHFQKICGPPALKTSHLNYVPNQTGSQCTPLSTSKTWLDLQALVDNRANLQTKSRLIEFFEQIS